MKRVLGALIVLSLMLPLGIILTPQPVAAMTGSGTEADPYVIYNITDLQDISNDLSAWYRLANDIEGSGTPFTPLGTFTGVLDGRGYTVNGLTITVSGTGTRSAALMVTNQGTVENLNIYNCNISATSTNGGQCRAAAVCYNNDGGEISWVGVTGNVSATIPVLSAAWVQAAGLVAWNEGGNITNCFSTATVVATSGGGGLVGGLVANNEGTVSESFASGNVTGTISAGNGDLYVGGFAGTNGFDVDGAITDCYSMGNATANSGNPSYAGGFVASVMTAGSTITNAYSTGMPVAATTSGGLCATNAGTVTNCFWDTETSGAATSSGGTGANTTEMKTRSTFTDAGWLFTPDYPPQPVWSIYDFCNDGYPYICDFCYLDLICEAGCVSDSEEFDDVAVFNSTVPDNTNNWTHDMVYYTYYLHSVNETLVAWYQPSNLITGVTLPDRAGAAQNGTINWGGLPPGVNSTLGSLTVEESPVIIDETEDEYTAIVPEVEVTDWFLEPAISTTLSTHPLRPLVTIMSNGTTITEVLAWRFLGLALVLLMTTLAAVLLRGHLLLAGLVCGGTIAVLVQQTVWPGWTLAFIIPAVIAGIMAERTPSIG